MPAIDGLLPKFDVAVRHERRLAASPERALAAALATAVAADPIVRVLFWLRGIRVSGTFEEGLPFVGFRVLERTSTEIVFGMSGTPWRLGGGSGPFAEAKLGTVRMAMDLRAEPLPDGGVPPRHGNEGRRRGRARAAELPPLLAPRRTVFRAHPAALARGDRAHGLSGPVRGLTPAMAAPASSLPPCCRSLRS